MQKELSDFQNFFNSKKFTVANKALEKLFKKFKFSNEINDFQNSSYINNVKLSKIIIINQYNNQPFYITAFKNTLQVIYFSDFSSTIKKLFNVNPKVKFCFISNSSNHIFDNRITSFHMFKE